MDHGNVAVLAAVRGARAEANMGGAAVFPNVFMSAVLVSETSEESLT